jgi:CheY-like chemotaxis protein
MSAAGAVPILVVEDNPGDVFLVKRALKKHGIESELRVEEDGQAAIQFFDRLDIDESVPCPHIVLVDLNLPRITGERVLERVRRSLRCPDIPVIVMTSSDSPLDHAAAAKLGADRYFLKPNDLESFMRLGEVVTGLLQSRRKL